MTYDNFTTRAQESILKGQQIAGGYDQQQVDTTHLLKGMLETDESVVAFLLKKMNVEEHQLHRRLDEVIKNYPKVKGSEKQYLTPDANKALSTAKKALPEFGDEYISVELMLYGIVQGK
ncbi:MAG: Clp protease N-terminal domain-containing protein, partial [Bacteroidota bacterium]